MGEREKIVDANFMGALRRSSTWSPGARRKSPCVLADVSSMYSHQLFPMVFGRR